MQLEKWVVGEEYDEVALERLKRALKDLQYTVQDRWSAIVGSQDIQSWTMDGPRGRLMVERETYIRLWVEGSSSLISELQAQYEKAVPDDETEMDPKRKWWQLW